MIRPPLAHWLLLLWEQYFQDCAEGHMLNLKFALRTLFKTPFVTAIAIISIALGIGANTAIFSIFRQVLLRSLPGR
jgi:hypothetical protein